jgi:uncharacterized protein YecE (DUF72 family)
MRPENPTAPTTELTPEERRERRRLRREKQRESNIGRAAKMHKVRLKMEADGPVRRQGLKEAVYVGCSGWRYWKWRHSFYQGVPQPDWFKHYAGVFDTVEINASFYSWPTVASVQAWRRQPGSRDFVYTVKVCELITHIKKFKGTKTLIRDFGMIADILGERMGCFLFQLPPSSRYTKSRLNAIVSQLDPARRNAVEFRHKSWWNEEVYAAFRKAGLIFCSCSGPRLPDELVKTADEVYVRLHGLFAGIGTTIPTWNSRNGPRGSRLAGRKRPGFISITTTALMLPKTQKDCKQCSRQDGSKLINRN